MKFGLFGYKVCVFHVFKNKSLIPITVLSVPLNFISEKFLNLGKYYFKINFFYKKKICYNSYILNKFLKIKKFVNKYKILNVNKFIFYKFKNKINIPLNIFYINQFINVKSKNIGKGFSGVLKRHNFKSGRSTHGNSKSHRSHGSTGMCQDPGRVFLGKKMAGRLGNKFNILKNLKIINIDFDNNLLYIKGLISGYNNCLVFIYFNF